MLENKNINSKKGFTIIEVVLVLAIAGLIFLMVFVALPALQRSQRDTQRRDDLARVSTAITQYQTNNGGKLPNTGSVAASTSDSAIVPSMTYSNNAATNFIAKYMNTSTDKTNQFVDPDGWYYGLNISKLSSGTKTIPGTMDHIIYVVENAYCNGEVPTYVNTARSYAIAYKLEGAGTYCADNT